MFPPKLNDKLPAYASLILDPNAMEADALNIFWDKIYGYAFSPKEVVDGIKAPERLLSI